MSGQCSVEGCERPVKGKGMCNMHYLRWYKHGNPLVGGRPPRAKTCSIDGCEKDVLARGWCNMHYTRWQNHSDPLGGSSTFVGDPAKWLLERLDYTGDDCLLWPYAETKNGYSVVVIDKRNEGAHVVMCTIVHGAKPTPRHEVLHSCRQGHLGCVTPKHLAWGTHKENMLDVVEHGTSTRGERHRNVKLKESQVLLIYNDCRTQTVIANEYDVHFATVSDIKLGKTWAWLTGAQGNLP